MADSVNVANNIGSKRTGVLSPPKTEQNDRIFAASQGENNMLN
jgi:hypothetical protein